MLTRGGRGALLAAAVFAAPAAFAQTGSFSAKSHHTVDVGNPVNIPIHFNANRGARSRSSITASGIPPGLNFSNPSGSGNLTGHLTGRPSRAGNYTINFTGRLTPGRGATHSLHMTVLALPEVSVTSTANTLAENATLTFAVQRNRGTAAIEVAYAASGTATAGDDYTALDGTLQIAANENSAEAVIESLQDGLVELDESIVITLTAPAGHTAAAPANFTITDAERAAASIAFGDDAAGTGTYETRVAENVAGGILEIPVSINHPPAENVVFRAEVTGGDATEGAQNDYTLAASTVTFTPAGARTAHLKVTLNDDTDIEADESVLLRITAADDPADDLGDYYTRAGAAHARIIIGSEDAPSKPGAPQLQTPQPGSASIMLAWDAPADDGRSAITGYLVRWKLADAAAYGAPQNTAVTNYTITGLQNGATYDAQAAAQNAVGAGPYSAAVRAVAGESDNMVSALALHGGGEETTLDPSAAGASATFAGGVSTVMFTPTAASTASAVTFENLANAAQVSTPPNMQSGALALDYHENQIRISLSAENRMPRTYQISITRSPGAPGVPQSVAVALRGRGLHVTWRAPDDLGGADESALQYAVQWRNQDGVNAGGDAETAAGETAYAIPGLQAGATYAVKVRARNASFDGEFSAEVSAVPSNFDIDFDGNGVDYEDGIVVARYLLGATEAALTANLRIRARADGVRRKLAAAKRSRFDVDGVNGVTAVDALLIARYLLGVTSGRGLTGGLAGPEKESAILLNLQNLTGQ